MDFLRRHAFVIVSAVVGVAGIVLMITGVQAMPKVLEEMKKAETLYRNLDSLSSPPVNLARFDAATRRIELLVADRNRVLTKAKEMYGYEPLVEGVLPDGDAFKRNEFRRRYLAEMERLLASLNYGGPPTQADIELARDRIAEEEAERKAYGLERGAAPPPLGPQRTPAGVLTEAGVRQDPFARASIAAAQRIFCYARHFNDDRPPDNVSSLDVRPVMKDVSTVDPPDLWEVWHAQLGYWIQKDVVNAIVSLNNEAAEETTKKGQHPWVGIMPVKELISIRLFDGYIPREGELIFGSEPGGYTAAMPPGTPETVFTRSGQSPTYDVIQFAVKLIMDQRDIPRLIERLCKNSFHTLLRVSYVSVPVNRNMVGKIYGGEPAVNVVMDFETIMLGEVFRPLMPESVCEYYEIPCPKRE